MYKLTDSTSILRKSDDVVIPADPGNRDYAAYLAWLAAGNTPEPAATQHPNIAVMAQIDTLERAAMLNRGSRELELFLMEDRAAQVAAATGATAASLLDANSYYKKLKALDMQIAQLRWQLS